MRTINRLRDTSYELVYSTRNPKAGNRNGNAGNRPSRRRSNGSRNAEEVSTAGNFKNAISELTYYAEEKRKNYTPADVIKKHQDLRKRGEDKKGEGNPRKQ